MAGFMPAIRVFDVLQGVDAQPKAGHDAE